MEPQTYLAALVYPVSLHRVHLCPRRAIISVGALGTSDVPWSADLYDTNKPSDRVQWFSPASWLCRQIHQAAVLTRLQGLEAPFSPRFIASAHVSPSGSHFGLHPGCPVAAIQSSTRSVIYILSSPITTQHITLLLLSDQEVTTLST